MNGTPGQSFSPVATARRVLRLAATGGLASLDAGGAPFASLVTVATTIAGEPLFLLSDLAVHTANLKRDGRASLLLVEPGGETGDPLAGARLTLVGRVARDAAQASRARFLAHHEEAAAYADFADFAFYRLEVAGAHLVAGFGRIVDLQPADLLIAGDGLEALAAAEAGAIAHMNADHAVALRLYATKLLGLPDGDWRMTGCDPDGIDLRAGVRRARLAFPERITTPGALRSALATLADEARRRS